VGLRIHRAPDGPKGPTSITILGIRAFARKIRHVGRMVDIMMDNPDRNWGKPFYPVVS
jgi:hypothetical protein